MFKQTTLKNGLRIVTEKADFNTVTIGVWVGTGANNENDKLNGISHVLEHMAFKGTTTKTAQELANQIESLGGYCNAYTANEVTAYHVSLLPKDWKAGVDFLGDILQNSTFPEKELESEKKVILQEILRCQDNPNCCLYDLLLKNIYKGSMAAHPVIGTAKNVKSFTSKDLKAYMKKYYTFDNMVVSAAGNISHRKFVKYIKSVFTNFEVHAKYKMLKPEFKAGTYTKKSKFDQAQLFVCYEGLGNKDKDRYTSIVFDNILDGMSNRLFQVVREKHGLAYAVGSMCEGETNYGILGAIAGVSNANTKKAAKLCKEVLESMKTDISDEELEKAKNICAYKAATFADDCNNIAIKNACEWLLHGKIVTSKEKCKKIMAVTKEQVFDFAKKYLKDDKLAIVILKGNA